MNDNLDYKFKIIVIGDSNVGKSSLLLRFVQDKFQGSIKTTIGFDFFVKSLNICGSIVQLEFQDTAGSEQYRAVTSRYYKGVDAIIMVYDVTKYDSFKDLDKYWINEVENYANNDVQLLLIGNKIDLNSCKYVSKQQKNIHRVPTEEAIQFAYSNDMDFAEVSAKTSDKVNIAFVNLAKKLMLKKDLQGLQVQIHRPLRAPQIQNQIKSCNC